MNIRGLLWKSGGIKDNFFWSLTISKKKFRSKSPSLFVKFFSANFKHSADQILWAIRTNFCAIFPLNQTIESQHSNDDIILITVELKPLSISTFFYKINFDVCSLMSKISEYFYLLPPQVIRVWQSIIDCSKNQFFFDQVL